MFRREGLRVVRVEQNQRRLRQFYPGGNTPVSAKHRSSTHRASTPSAETPDTPQVSRSASRPDSASRRAQATSQAESAPTTRPRRGPTRPSRAEYGSLGDERITLSCRVSDALWKQLEARLGDNRSDLIRRDLERYYEVLAAELRELALTEDEAWKVVEVLHGYAGPVGVIWAVLEQAGATALAGAIKKLPGAAAAVLDATERFWAGEEHGAQGLRETGLIG